MSDIGGGYSVGHIFGPCMRLEGKLLLGRLAIASGRQGEGLAYQG